MGSMPLPVVADAPAVRADAARNRLRILAAAGTLFAERGVAATSMDAIAEAAGVGKGTLFRRFGDRAGLALAVLDEGDRVLQESLLRGPPPLGPGAPVRDRLIAFGEAMLDRLERSGAIIAAAEASPDVVRHGAGPYGAYSLHLRILLGEDRSAADAAYLADILLVALGARLFGYQRTARGMSVTELKQRFAHLVDALTRA
jgi:AcrR family transcriptional regulator